MNVLIVEDEIFAAKRLHESILKVVPHANIVKQTDSIESTVGFLNTKPLLDLIFMDIQLGDGLSFSIFEETKVDIPVIFTTAYDKYSIDAFKVHSIDYLLKPIEEDALANAIEKFNKYYKQDNLGVNEQVLQMIKQFSKQQYKERIYIKKSQTLEFKKVSNVACLFAEGKLCFGIDLDGQKFILDQNLQELETQLNPGQFFRINRHFIINIEAIKKVHIWLGNRLKLDLSVDIKEEVIVSRERVNDFKNWLGK